MGAGSCIILGAGPGLGTALGRRFAREGMPLALLNRSLQASRALAAELAAQGGRAEVVQVELSSAEAVRAAVEQALALLGDPAVLLFNASRFIPGPGSALPPEQLEEDFRINVVAALVAVQTALGAMRARGAGTIILTGGGAALSPAAGSAALSATKAALRALAQSLFLELEPEGIHAATVTIDGIIGSSPPLGPERIAETYWELHCAPRERWVAEVRHPGA